MSRERELKLVVPMTFALPAWLDLPEGAVVRPATDRWLEARYFDTPDLRLARWGASLRHRGDEGWTVKLDAGREGDVLVRTEVHFPGEDPSAPPEPARELVRAFARTMPLVEVVEVGTLRRPAWLEGPRGEAWAEIVFDDVSVRAEGVATGRFREVEVEMTDVCPAAVAAEVEARLRAAGAGTSEALAKHLRALGYTEAPPREVVVPALGPSPTAGDVVHRAIASAVVRLIEHDPVVRLDHDPEGVHQARVATRRLRSDLRTFGSLIDQAFIEEVDDDLRWLAGALGGARDTDVLMGRIRERADRLPETERAGASAVVEALGQADKEAHAALLDAVRDDRYVALLESLVTAALASPTGGELAGRAAAAVLPGLVSAPSASLRTAVEHAVRAPTDERLHAVRIKAKRVRYAAEAVAAVLGSPAADLGAAAEELQTVLGLHHDAVVAEAWLRAWVGGGTSVDAAFAAGAIAGAAGAEADRARRKWRAAWQRVATAMSGGPW